MVTAVLKSRVCSSCNKEVTRWTDQSNWDTCDCGGQLQNKYGSRITDGDGPEFFSQELGLLGEQQKEYRLTHPDAEFSSTGALKIKGFKHLEKVLRDKGMVVLTESRKYREHQAELLEQAREKRFDNENY